MNRFYSAVVPAIAAAGLLVAACGGSSSPSGSPGSSGSSSSAGPKTAAEIVPKMEAAVKAAKSVHVAGTVKSGGQTLTVDLDVLANSDLSGTVSEGSGYVGVLSVAGTTYIKVDKAFLKSVSAPASACKIICGKYVKISSSQASQITGSLSLKQLAQQTFGKLPASASADTTDKFVPATYNGMPVLRYTKGSATLDVARSGPPYPVVLSAAGATIVYSEWNSVPQPVAPPASKIVNLSS